MISIQNEQDSQLALSLRGLLDLAVKTGGLQVADVALHIDQMIVEAGRQWESSKISKG